MGQAVSVDSIQLKSKSNNVAGISDLTNHIAKYLSTEDLGSIHSTAKSQSQVVGKNMKYIEARCAEETVDGLACNTANMPVRCKNWCKENNSIRKFYSVFKMLSQEGATFKFDNHPKEYRQEIEVYGSDVISIRLDRHPGSMYTLKRYNAGREFSETDTSFSYWTYTSKGAYNALVYRPEVIRSKFELLVPQPFSEWGEWELILPVSFHNPVENYTRSRDVNEEQISQRERLPGALYFKGRSIPCKGEITDISSRGVHRINIYITSRP